jgi:hypothetical protein
MTGKKTIRALGKVATATSHTRGDTPTKGITQGTKAGKGGGQRPIKSNPFTKGKLLFALQYQSG